jgi:hypothetical protein
MVQSSAIRAAILEEGKEEPEDGDKPLTREEMVARAAAHAAKLSSEVRPTYCALCWQLAYCTLLCAHHGATPPAPLSTHATIDVVG